MFLMQRKYRCLKILVYVNLFYLYIYIYILVSEDVLYRIFFPLARILANAYFYYFLVSEDSVVSVTETETKSRLVS